MKTTYEIPDDIIEEVKILSKSKTKKKAIVVALEEYIKMARRKMLIDRISSGVDFGLSLSDLKKMRSIKK